ncbi:MAG: hypothetical protein IJU71_08730 [Selenomonadaceae bacterium]|nr:hypothetical protein [Selenomonadaceae bacterium]
MMQKIYKFFKEKKEKGQSIIEYGILVAVIITAVISFKNSTSLSTQLDTVNSNIASAISNGATHVSVKANT